MPNYFYVKSGGTLAATADTPYATAQTSSFATIGAANYYNNWADAVNAGKTTPPVAGDFILFSSAHSASSAATIVQLAATGAGINYISVDDSNASIPLAGATEATTGGGDFTLGGTAGQAATTQGMTLDSNDNIGMATSTNSTFRDCTLILKTSAAQGTLNGDGTCARFYDCELQLNNATARLSMAGGSLVEMFGGSVTSTAVPASVFSGGMGGGGGRIHFSGVDMSGLDATTTFLDAVGSSAGVDDGIDVVLDYCRIPSGFAFTSEDFKSENQRLVATRCSSSSADAEHMLYVKAWGGEAFDDATIRRADDDPFTDSAQNISYKVDTNADADPARPFWFDFPTPQWSDLTAGASDTLRFYVASSTALTDADIYFEVAYGDGTAKNLAKFASTRVNPIVAGTALATDSGSDWRDGAGAYTGNEYLVDLATTTGVDGYPSRVRCFTTKPNTILYIASEYGLV